LLLTLDNILLNFFFDNLSCVQYYDIVKYITVANSLINANGNT